MQEGFTQEVGRANRGSGEESLQPTGKRLSNPEAADLFTHALREKQRAVSSRKQSQTKQLQLVK